MSGGSHQYLCYNLDDWHISEDLKAMLSDIFRAVEWAESMDTKRSDAQVEVYQRVLEFMDKEAGRT